MENLSMDSTGIKVHESPMAGKPKDRAVGRTRGGLNTKLHAIVDRLRSPVEFLLSAGNDHDCIHAVELLEKVELNGSNMLADRAYSAQLFGNTSQSIKLLYNPALKQCVQSLASRLVSV